MTSPSLPTEVLRDCVLAATDEERAAAVAGCSDDEIMRLAFHALRHRVVPALYLAVRTRDDVDPKIVAAIRRAHAVRGGEQLRTLGDLAAATNALEAVGVEVLVVKGPVVAERLYPSSDLRPYDDLDLLVRPEDLPAAVSALEGAGAELLDRNWTLIRDERRGQLHLRLPLGTVVDLHWHLLNRGVVRKGFDMKTEDVFARARAVTIAGLTVRTLDATDTLLHLCVHAALSGADRLVWVRDIQLAIEVDAPPWDDVVARALAFRAGPSVAIALARTRRELGAPVPPGVERRLFGSSLRSSISAVLDRRWPVHASTGRQTPASIWPQAARDRWSTTARMSEIRLRRRTRSIVHGRAGERAPIFEEAGSEADEREFLLAVSRDDDRRGPSP